MAEDHAGWMSRSRVFLTPDRGAVDHGPVRVHDRHADAGAWQAGWYGGAATSLLIFPFAMVAGGLTAGAMTIEHSFGRTIVPIGKWSKKGNIPGAQATDPIAYPAGMSGVPRRPVTQTGRPPSSPPGGRPASPLSGRGRRGGARE